MAHTLDVSFSEYVPTHTSHILYVRVRLTSFANWPARWWLQFDFRASRSPVGRSWPVALRVHRNGGCQNTVHFACAQQSRRAMYWDFNTMCTTTTWSIEERVPPQSVARVCARRARRPANRRRRAIVHTRKATTPRRRQLLSSEAAVGRSVWAAWPIKNGKCIHKLLINMKIRCVWFVMVSGLLSGDKHGTVHRFSTNQNEWMASDAQICQEKAARGSIMSLSAFERVIIGCNIKVWNGPCER